MGYEVRAVTSWYPGLKMREVLNGYTVERVGTHDNYILYVPQVLKKYASWADVIVEDTSKIPLMVPLMRRRNGIKVLAIVHHLNRNIYFYELPFIKAVIAYSLETIMPSLYSRLPDVWLIAVSNSTREELIKLNADPNRIFIVPNGIDNKNNNRFFEKDPTPTVLYLSRAKAYKQPHHAIIAFSKVLKRVPHARLIIAGKEMDKLYKNVIQKLNKNIEIYGKIDEETKTKLLCKAWLLIQTSLKEGFGITVLEAAMCRTPVVAYRVPGLKDSIKHMETGILVEPGNIEQLAEAIVWLLTDDKLRSRLAENAHRYAQSFSWDRTAEAIAKILGELWKRT